MARELRSASLIYDHSPRAEVQRLEAFRARCEGRYVQGGYVKAWSMGEGENVVVFLPSGMAHGEIWFPYLLGLHQDVRAVALSLPPLSEISKQVEVLWDALDGLGVKQCVLVAQSLGGMIAQAMTRARPDRVRALVLVTTSAPAESLSPARKAQRSKRALNLRMRLLPFSLHQVNLPGNAFRRFCPEEYRDRMEFWEAFIEETYLYHCYKKQHIALNMDFVGKFYRAVTYTPKDLETWPGNIIIYESEQDNVFQPDEREALKALYPGAEVHTLPGGQFLPMIHEQALIKRLRELLLTAK